MVPVLMRENAAGNMAGVELALSIVVAHLMDLDPLPPHHHPPLLHLVEAQVISGYRLTTNEGRNDTHGTAIATFRCNGTLTSKHKQRRTLKSSCLGVGWG
jgi:hypothetical protein